MVFNAAEGETLGGARHQRNPLFAFKFTLENNTVNNNVEAKIEFIAKSKPRCPVFGRRGFRFCPAGKAVFIYWPGMRPTGAALR